MSAHRDGTPHRWRISEPNGTPLLIGKCHGCGAVREYRASLEDDQAFGQARKRPMPRRIDDGGQFAPVGRPNKRKEATR